MCHNVVPFKRLNIHIISKEKQPPAEAFYFIFNNNKQHLEEKRKPDYILLHVINCYHTHNVNPHTGFPFAITYQGTPPNHQRIINYT